MPAGAERPGLRRARGAGTLLGVLHGVDALGRRLRRVAALAAAAPTTAFAVASAFAVAAVLAAALAAGLAFTLRALPAFADAQRAPAEVFVRAVARVSA